MTPRASSVREAWLQALRTDTTLDNIGKLAAYALGSTARADGTNALLSGPALALAMQMSQPTAFRALGRLRALGWVEQTEKGRRRGTVGTASKYRLTVPDPTPAAAQPISQVIGRGTSQPISQVIGRELSLPTSHVIGRETSQPITAHTPADLPGDCPLVLPTEEPPQCPQVGGPLARPERTVEDLGPTGADPVAWARRFLLTGGSPEELARRLAVQRFDWDYVVEEGLMDSGDPDVDDAFTTAVVLAVRPAAARHGWTVQACRAAVQGVRDQCGVDEQYAWIALEAAAPDEVTVLPARLPYLVRSHLARLRDGKAAKDGFDTRLAVAVEQRDELRAKAATS